MPQTKIYVLNKKIFSSMKGRYGNKFICSQCELKFKLYDLVVSKPSRSKGKAKWYHFSCLEKLYL